MSVTEVQIKLTEKECAIVPLLIRSGLTAEESQLTEFVDQWLKMFAAQINENRRPGELIKATLERMMGQLEFPCYVSRQCQQS